MSVSYYDLLDVDPGASADEIRAAWRGAVADLDPTDRRFRALSTAAEVLLDPGRRAAYDDELAAAQEREAAEVRTSDTTADAGETASTHDAPTHERAAGWVPPGWLLAVAGVLALALVATAVWLGLQPSAADVEDSSREAQAAAESAVGLILDYDARDPRRPRPRRTST